MLDFEFNCTNYTAKLGLCWMLSSTVLPVPLNWVYVGFGFNCTNYTAKLGLCWILSSSVLIIPLSWVYVGF